MPWTTISADSCSMSCYRKSKGKTPGGLPIRLSTDPNDRATAGSSTGGIGAFTLEHPDAFRRVFTAFGTFVGMRGGDRYAVLVRKTEPKPIRIYMQDGSHDELTTFHSALAFGPDGRVYVSEANRIVASSFAGRPSIVAGESGDSISS
jgi:hypothetical protein